MIVWREDVGYSGRMIVAVLAHYPAVDSWSWRLTGIERAGPVKVTNGVVKRRSDALKQAEATFARWCEFAGLESARKAPVHGL